MDSASLVEDFETGLFRDEAGRLFVRCEFNPEHPVWIDVSGELWSTAYAGLTHELNWAELDLPDIVKTPLQQVMLVRLKERAPGYLSQVKCALALLAKASASCEVHFQHGFSGVAASKWLCIWEELDSYSRSLVRSLYQELAEKELAGADFALAKEMGRWRARRDTQTLRRVMEWDADSGSFTSAEWELIRAVLNRDDPEEGDGDCAARMFARVCNETLKRPTQILAMKRDALWVAPSGREFFLRIPKAKGQVGERAASWQITDALAKAIQTYSERPQIRALQKRFDRLIVMPRGNGEESRWMAHGQVDVGIAKARLQHWIRRQGIISPRTKGDINLTPYRIRHTGATAMALQGVPRDEIQEVLEHDSPASADAYIQAVGSDLIPALERATDRGVGKVFSELHNAYFFKGALIDKVVRRPIHIPITVESVAAPAVVGACGKDGACTKHPFWACYNGCPHFLAWRDAPHTKSLEYVETELERWSDAEGGKERSKLGKDFDRVGAAIKEVIRQIEQSKADGVDQ